MGFKMGEYGIFWSFTVISRQWDKIKGKSKKIVVNGLM